MPRLPHLRRVLAALVLALTALAYAAPRADAQSAPTNRITIIVAFAPDARLEEVGAWLKEHDASIVEGPRGGMYRLRVGDKVLKPDEMTALLAELGKAPIVRMVLPAN